MDIAKEIEKIRARLCREGSSTAFKNDVIDILAELNNQIGRIDYIGERLVTLEHPPDKQPEVEGWKPCPFCGCHRIDWTCVNTLKGNKYACWNCGAQTGYHKEALDAKKAWNCRSTDA